MDGEVYPPTVNEVQVDMHYPPHIPESRRFAVGHEAFGLVPGLMMYATIWLREHNRVCDILKQEHPDWDDERLFQTSRLILIGKCPEKRKFRFRSICKLDVLYDVLMDVIIAVPQYTFTKALMVLTFVLYSDFTGETIKIVIEDYVQHLSGYHFKLKFDPELLFNERFQYQNRIASEFNTLYHWHPLMPNEFHIQDEVYDYKQFLFNTSILTDHGVNSLVESFTKQIAGRVSFHVF